MLTIDPTVFQTTTISEETAALNAELREWHAARPSPWDFTVEQLRAARAAGASIFPEEPVDPDGENLIASALGFDVPVRVLRCKGEARGTYLHIHGGGWTWGTAYESDLRLRELSDACQLDCVSVDYRLAPEHPYPAAPDDCEAVAMWLLDGDHGLATSVLAIGGESAGAHLSVVTLLRLRARLGHMPFHGANLIAGCYDLGIGGGVRNWPHDRLILTHEDVRQFTGFYVPETADNRDGDVSPIFADLTGMPPAIFTVGTLDILLDDTLQMSARWQSANGNAELLVQPGGCHVYQAFRDLPITRESDAASYAFLNLVSV